MSCESISICTWSPESNEFLRGPDFSIPMYIDNDATLRQEQFVHQFPVQIRIRHNLH